MHSIDLIIIVILLLGAIRGYQKGFFHEVATLAGLIAGVFIAILASNLVGGMAERLVDWNIQVVKVVTFIIVFVVVAWFIRMLGTLLTNLFKALMLGFINRLAGFAIGILKWALILAVILMVVEFFDPGNRLISEKMSQKSFFFPQLEFLYDHITEAIGFDNFPGSINSWIESSNIDGKQ